MDYQATTPLAPEALAAMMPYLTTKFGNPHSVSHKFGWEAEAGVERARLQVASLIGAEPDEIIFTSGATESNNLAIKGLARGLPQGRREIVTCVTEHKCLLASCRTLEREGFRVTYLPVLPSGLVDLGRLSDAITGGTGLVSIMAVHNEIGVVQPLHEIGEICRDKNVIFHTDAAQALGKIALDVRALNISLMSLSAHKIYGPKGLGALYLRKTRPRLHLVPLIDGGGQERGLRSGTLAPALCAGMGEACQIFLTNFDEENSKIKALSDKFINAIWSGLEGVSLNGDPKLRFPGNINLSFAGVGGDMLLAELRNLAVSSGAACASAAQEPSYVLEALGVSESLIKASIRFGIGRYTTEAEIDFAAAEVIAKVNRLRLK
jgi:cysteine desulfurase